MEGCFLAKKFSVLRKVAAALVSLVFFSNVVLPPQPGAAQLIAETVLHLPAPGTMVRVSPGFSPAVIQGLTVYPENPLLFDFLIFKGEEPLTTERLNDETRKLIKYFLAALTVPEEDLWVNLSPYEKERVIPESLGRTGMGRDLLAQDYLLKQLTASLMYPEEELGKKFWERVYAQAREKFGTTDIPLSTFHKVWIAPDRAAVYEQGQSVFVVESHLKVMLEEDLPALKGGPVIGEERGEDFVEEEAREASGLTAAVVREVLIPELEKEVNEGKAFASLRQITHALILASWYKQNLRESLLGKVYVDQNKIAGVDSGDEGARQRIYQQYLAALEKGVFNYIREDYDPVAKDSIPRQYFSGGFSGRFNVQTSGIERIQHLTREQRERLANAVDKFIARTQLLEKLPAVEAARWQDETIDAILEILAHNPRVKWMTTQQVFERDAWDETHPANKIVMPLIFFLDRLSQANFEGAAELKNILMALLNHGLPLHPVMKSAPALHLVHIREREIFRELLGGRDFVAGHASDRGIHLFQQDPVTLMHELIAFLGLEHRESVAFELWFGEFLAQVQAGRKVSEIDVNELRTTDTLRLKYIERLRAEGILGERESAEIAMVITGAFEKILTMDQRPADLLTRMKEEGGLNRRDMMLETVSSRKAALELLLSIPLSERQRHRVMEAIELYHEGEQLPFMRANEAYQWQNSSLDILLEELVYNEQAGLFDVQELTALDLQDDNDADAALLREVQQFIEDLVNEDFHGAEQLRELFMGLLLGTLPVNPITGNEPAIFLAKNKKPNDFNILMLHQPFIKGHASDRGIHLFERDAGALVHELIAFAGLDDFTAQAFTLLFESYQRTRQEIQEDSFYTSLLRMQFKNGGEGILEWILKSSKIYLDYVPLIQEYMGAYILPFQKPLQGSFIEQMIRQGLEKLELMGQRPADLLTRMKDEEGLNRRDMMSRKGQGRPIRLSQEEAYKLWMLGLNVTPQASRKISDAVREGMTAGAARDESSIPMFSTFVYDSPEKDGEYIVIDFGGTNLRVMRVILRQGQAPQVVEEIKKPFGREHIEGRKDPFRFIAETIRELGLEEREYNVGLTFSFGMEQKSMASGIAHGVDGDKGWNGKNIDGRDVGQLMQSALDEVGLSRVRVVALLNDTVATLLAIPGADLSLIDGTGMNMALIHPQTGELINTEVERFVSEAFPLTPYEETLFKHFVPEGRHMAEKLIAGTYQAELLRMQLRDMTDNPVWRKALEPRGALKPEFITEYFQIAFGGVKRTPAEVEQLSRQTVNKYFQIPGEALSQADLALIVQLAYKITQRSARVLASVIAGAVRFRDYDIEDEHRVSVDGSFYFNHPWRKRLIRDAFIEYLGEERASRIILVDSPGASIVGAAHAAARAAQSNDSLEQEVDAGGRKRDDGQDLGGIYLTPVTRNLKIQRDPDGVPLPVNRQPIHEMKIEGFVPVILEIVPAVSLPVWFGAGQQEEGEGPEWRGPHQDRAREEPRARFEFENSV